MKPSELRNLIRALGGTKVVARACDVTSQAVSHWKSVPPEHVVRIEEMARLKRVLRSDGTPYSVAVLRPDMVRGFDRIEPASRTAAATLVDAD